MSENSNQESRSLEKAHEAHQKEREVLFRNEALVISVFQALTGGALFATISGSEQLTTIIGEWQFLVVLTTVDLALLSAVLAAWGKLQFKKWDVKATASAFKGQAKEAENRTSKSNFYLAAMRWSMTIAVSAISIALVEMPVFAWMMTRSAE